MALPPKDMKAGRLMALIITRGVLPHATVDFPRVDDAGETIAKVFLRPLTQAEQDTARARAALYVTKMCQGDGEVRWKPEELEDNATASEILSIACRDPDEPEKAFFERGVVDTRLCTTDELSMLFASYNAVREKAYPTLRELTEEEMWAWTRVLEEGAADFPFSRISRAKLEAYCTWAATSLVSLQRLVTGLTSSSLQPSPSAESLPATEP